MHTLKHADSQIGPLGPGGGVWRCNGMAGRASSQSPSIKSQVRPADAATMAWQQLESAGGGGGRSADHVR